MPRTGPTIWLLAGSAALKLWWRNHSANIRRVSRVGGSWRHPNGQLFGLWPHGRRPQVLGAGQLARCGPPFGQTATVIGRMVPRMYPRVHLAPLLSIEAQRENQIKWRA